MAGKSRCRRCGAYASAGTTECQPKVIYRREPLPRWLYVALSLGVSAWGWLMADAALQWWP